jgi:hypothetical protein
VALSDNLVSYWSLDEASGNALDAHGSNNLTEINTVGTATGRVGNARGTFSSSSGRFVASSSSVVQIGDADATLAGWVRVNSDASPYGVLGKYVTSGNQRSFRILAGSNGFRFTFTFQVSSDGTSSTLTGLDWSGTASTGVWYFIVCRHDAAANQISLSVNGGTPATASHSGGLFASSSVFELGRNGSSGNLNGLLDEWGYWSRLLTADEITELYNSGSGMSYADITGGGGGGAASRLTKYAQNIPHMHGNNRFIRIGR